MSLARILFGRPLATEEDEGERVGPLAGVPILGLDALASASYGPEALLTVLLGTGLAGAGRLPWITVVILGVITLVFVSYRQTIRAYPGGGGAYTVAKENLGELPSLLAASALALDYILNVAVAISAGVGALVSAVPALLPFTLPLCLGVLALLTLVNLRGVRATGVAFMIPTWTFVATLFVVIAIGLAKTVLAGGAPEPIEPPPPPIASDRMLSAWLLVHAFASGCTAMTGIEAVSNGVPIFRAPSERGALRTLTLIVVILAVLLAGNALLCRAYGITATEPGRAGYQSVLSMMVAAVVGRGPFYSLTIASVVAVLSLSANTSFADFPRLCRILAGDRYLPEHFMHRGRRLELSHGIIVLAAMAAMLLVVFRGVTEGLIHLFAVGALAAFTMSQAAMVAHWRKRGREGRHGLVVNAIGALATGATLCVVLIAKLAEGAWISALLFVGMIVLFRAIRRHFDFVDRATAAPEIGLEVGPPRPPIAVIPVRRWDAIALKAMRFAVGFAPEVVVVQVLTGDRGADDLSARWEELVAAPARRLAIPVPRLVVLRSEYRKLFAPLLDFVTELETSHPDRQIAVIVPELVEPRWYHYLLHAQTASVLKTLLLFRGGPQIVVVDTPWYLDEWLPERSRLWTGAARTFARWAGPRSPSEVR